MTETNAQTGEPQAPAQCLCCGLGPAITAALNRLGPPEEAMGHFRTARAEILKGLRAILDERISRLESTQQKGTKVPVE